MIGEVAASVRTYAHALAVAGVAVPEVAYFADEIGEEAFAELAWPAFQRGGGIGGDQATFASRWQRAGWRVVVLEEIAAKGVAWFTELIKGLAQGE